MALEPVFGRIHPSCSNPSGDHPSKTNTHPCDLPDIPSFWMLFRITQKKKTNLGREALAANEHASLDWAILARTSPSQMV